MHLNERQKKLLRFIGIKLAGALISVLLKTVRIRIINADVTTKLERQNKNYIVAFWHGSMLVGWYLQRNKNFSSLVSKSKDGEVLNSLLKKWKFTVVRGSSRDGGKPALEKMIELVNNKYGLAITPDGPTGPIYKMKAGAVIIAQRTSTPLLLVGIAIKNKWVLKSWDRFEIPKPFSRVIVKYSEPVIIDKNLTVEETNETIKKYEELLNSLQKEVLTLC